MYELECINSPLTLRSSICMCLVYVILDETLREGKSQGVISGDQDGQATIASHALQLFQNLLWKDSCTNKPLCTEAPSC